MMLTKTDGRPSVPRDGRHCDLCGCSQPAVRCDKCGRQAFCLSCDDMYHRHPKRRFHLRKAVDAAPPQRPALPAKGGGTAGSCLGGDPSKMPLPPPRKKKFFDTFRKRSPSGEQGGSPPLPKKEWSFGSIKNKFMSNRPLPPLPDTPTLEEEDITTTHKHDLAFIHKKVDEKPPQLPQRSLKPNEFNRAPHEKENQPNSTNGVREVRNGTLNPAHMNRNNNGYGEENQWNNRPPEHQNPNTLMRQPGYMYPGNAGYPGQMSSSTTDLHNMEMQHPQYPYPPMPYPHYPPPVYPHQYPGGYFGSSFGNLSTTENDHSDHSDVTGGRQGKKYQFRKRAKRSQSVLMDRMAYPGGQFYPPFGPFPPGGYGVPWGAPFPPSEHPPRSPTGSLSRVRTRRRKKTTSEEEEEFSVSSSPLSRPSSSSGRQQQRSVPPQVVSSSSSEEEFEVAPRSRNERVPRRDSDPKKISSSPVPRSPQMQQKKFFYKQKKSETLRSSDAEDVQKNVAKFDRTTASASKEIKAGPSTESPSSPAPFTPPSQWECVHCTFINSASNRICQVCCKTYTAEPLQEDGRNSADGRISSPLADGRISSMSTDGRKSAGPPMANDRNSSGPLSADGRNSAGPLTANDRSAGQLPAVGGRASSGKLMASDGRRAQSASSEQSCSSPEKKMEEEEDVDIRRNKQDMAVLNSALDEAEKEISRGLEELMKLKEDYPPAGPTPPPPALTKPPQQNKPVYKSTGKLRNNSNSILDKITMPQTTKTTSTSTSTSTETSQTSADRVIEARRGQTSSTDRVIEARRGQTSTPDHYVEARRGSTSSTTSDAYNSPTAQSPILQRTPQGGSTKKGPKRDTCMQTDDLMAQDDPYFGGRPPNNEYGYRYGDGMTSPVPSMYHHPVMQRSHSRASLFTGRMTDLGPLDYGLGASPMYRSVSRSSLTGDYPENSFADFHNLRKPAYYLSMEELVERRRQDSIRAQGLELVRMIREAEQQGFTADDIQVALHNCPSNQTPVEWLQENWRQLAAQVVALAANYAAEKRENDVGVVSDVEARDALRMHKGNVWPAVTECVESRQRKFLELKARGKFGTKDITDALSANQGDVELAYAKLSKSSSKPFLMRIWGAGEGAQNQDIPPKTAPTDAKEQDFYYKDRDDIRSTGTWDDDDVEWDEDYDEEEEEEHGDLEDLQTCHEDLTIKTPDSDRSDYCDAFGSNTLERNMTLPKVEPPETKLARRGSFLSKLAGLKRNDKDAAVRSSQIDLSSPDSSKYISQESLVPSPDQSKSYNPLSVIKNTISAIRDTVGGSKTEKKLPGAALERRTIVVKGQIPQESSSVASGGDSGVTLTSVKPLKDSESSTSVAHEVSEKNVKKNDSKDYPVKMLENVNLNQQVTQSDDIRNKSREIVSSEAVAKSSQKFEQLVLNKLDSKLQETSTAKGTSIIKGNKSKVKNSDNESTSKSKEEQAHTPETFKNNLENKQNDLKSEQNTQEFIKDTKKNVENESKARFSPETSFSPNKQSMPNTNEKEQKMKRINNFENEYRETDKTFINKLPSDDVSNTISSSSNMITDQEKEISSENETKTEIPLSIDQNITSRSISEERPNTVASKTHMEMPKENVFGNKASGSKDLIQNDLTEQTNLHLTDTSSSFINEANTYTGDGNTPITTDTTVSGNDESQITEDSNDFSNNSVKNAPECTSDKLVVEVSAHSTAYTSSERAEIPLMDGVDTSLSDANSHKNSTENESPTFESMEPIHSSTFKRSFSNQSTEAKVETQTSPDTLSLEKNIPPTNLSDNAATIIETPQNLTSQIPSVNAEAPVQVGEIKTGMVNETTEKGLKVVENTISKEMKEAASAVITSKLKKSVRLKEDVKPKMLASTSSNATEKIKVENSHVLEDNSLPSTETSSQKDVHSKSINQFSFEQKEELHSASGIQEAITDISSSPTSHTISSLQPSFSKEGTSNNCENLEHKISEPEHVHSSSVPVIPLTDASISSTSTVFASPDSFITVASDSNATSASSTVPLTTASTTVAPVPYGTGVTPVSDSSITANSIASTSVLNASTIVFNTSVSSAADASVPTASITASLPSSSFSTASTTIAPVEIDSASTIASLSDASLSIASTTIKSAANASAFITTSVSNTSVPTDSLPSAPLPVTSVSIISDSSAPTTSISTASPPIATLPTTFASPTDASISTPSSPITSVNHAATPTDSASTSPIISGDASTPTASIASSPITSAPDTSSTATTSPKSSPSTSIPSSPHIVGDASVPIVSSNTSASDASVPIVSSNTSAPDASIPTNSTPTSLPITDNAPTPVLTPQTSTENEISEDDISEPIHPIEALRHRFEGLVDEGSIVGPIRPASPFRRMSFRSIKGAIALERNRDSSLEKPWFLPKPKAIETKKPVPKRSLKQQMETERKVRQMVADRKVRTYRKAEIVVQLMDLNFEEEEAIQAATECSNFDMALSYLQQECLLCTGHFPVSHIISMVHCQHKACRDCIRAYFTVQIRDRNIMELLCPFCNEPDIADDDIAHDYFNHLDMMLKKLVDPEIHELFQRKLRDRVLMRDPSFRWCSQCSSGFLAMENMQRLVCPDCNAVTCSSCRRPWEKDHQGLTCEAFARLKDGNDNEAQAVNLAKQLTEDGIDCPRCHFRYALAKGGCMHFRCIQCQHDFCSGCYRPFKMGQKCGVSEFCAKLGLHAHHPRNCLFYLRDKDPEDLQRLLDLSDVKYDRDPPEEDRLDPKSGGVCQVMEQKETADGMTDDCCGKEVEEGFAGLCRLHYVEYLGQLVNKHQVDPIQIFENDDLELVLRRANIRLPPKRYRETDDSYRDKLVNLIHEELPLDKMDGS